MQKYHIFHNRNCRDHTLFDLRRQLWYYNGRLHFFQLPFLHPCYFVCKGKSQNRDVDDTQDHHVRDYDQLGIIDARIVF